MTVEGKTDVDLNTYQKNKLKQFKSLVKKSKYPQSTLPADFLQHLGIVYRIASGMRSDLWESGLVTEKITPFGVKLSSTEEQRIKESKASGIIYEADNLLEAFKKLKRVKTQEANV